MIKYALILAVIIPTGFYIDYNATMTERLKWQGKVQEATVKARKAEQLRQQVINDTLQIQFDKQKFINDSLNTSLDKLRNRPPRRSVSKDSRTNCKGANGAELAKRDAFFLTRYAARAATQDAALTACYAAYDTLGG